jgi:outer membrane autotransporter protein
MQSVEHTHLPGVLWDASSAFGLERGTLHLGFTGGLGDKDVQVKASGMLRDMGLAHSGAARLTSTSVGAFSLLTTGPWYAGSIVGGGLGRSESRNYLLGSKSDYDTSTIVAAGVVGAIVPLSEAVRFDLRSMLAYQRTLGEGHVDSLGVVYGDHTIEALSATLSGRLFAVFRPGSVTLRPYLQAGVTQRLHYDDRLQIGNVAFTLEEADTTFFAAGGLDLEIGRTLQLSAGVRQEHSDDLDSLAGRLGVLIKLN